MARRRPYKIVNFKPEYNLTRPDRINFGIRLPRAEGILFLSQNDN